MGEGVEAEARLPEAGTPKALPRVRDAWVFDTVQSSIAFSVRRMLFGRVRGEFTRWRGSMSFDPARPAMSQVNVRIDAASIDTGDAERDAHLRSADFLGADRHPTLSFESTQVLEVAPGRFAIDGRMSIRGVARDVRLEVAYHGMTRDRWGNDHASFSATATIDRRAFGLTLGEMPAGELLIGEAVQITIEIAASRSPLPRA